MYLLNWAVWLDTWVVHGWYTGTEVYKHRGHFWEENPLSYLHVFLAGMILARLFVEAERAETPLWARCGLGRHGGVRGKGCGITESWVTDKGEVARSLKFVWIMDEGAAESTESA